MTHLVICGTEAQAARLRAELGVTRYAGNIMPVSLAAGVRAIEGLRLVDFTVTPLAWTLGGPALSVMIDRAHLEVLKSSYRTTS